MISTDHFPDDDTVRAIGRAFLDRSLPKSEWTHAGHFAATLALLERWTPDAVLRDMPPAIRAYNVATGVANTDHGGYHHTITVASIRAAAAFREARGVEALHVTANALLGSPLGHRDWLLEYWSRATLFSVAARSSWRSPDLRPFPW